jgi:hypothetical protein
MAIMTSFFLDLCGVSIKPPNETIHNDREC